VTVFVLALRACRGQRQRRGAGGLFRVFSPLSYLSRRKNSALFPGGKGRCFGEAAERGG